MVAVVVGGEVGGGGLEGELLDIVGGGQWMVDGGWWVVTEDISIDA